MKVYIWSKAAPLGSFFDPHSPPVPQKKQNRPIKGRSYFFERVRGVEPLSRPWQGRIIAAIRYPLVY